jgi:hypothetical protein
VWSDIPVCTGKTIARGKDGWMIIRCGQD